MFACKCLVHTSHRTEFSAHGTSILMFRLSLIPDPFCRLRIHGTLPLCFPVQISSGLCHPVICLSCSPHCLLQYLPRCAAILRSHDSLFYIFQDSEGPDALPVSHSTKMPLLPMLPRSANRRSNMVISRSQYLSQVVPIHKTALPDKWTAALSYLPRSDPEAYVPDLPPSPEHPSPMPAWSVRPDAPAPQSGRRPVASARHPGLHASPSETVTSYSRQISRISS